MNQHNINNVHTKFHQNMSEYDAEITITIQSKNKELRELIMNSIFVDHQNGKLIYEASSQDPDSLSFLRRIFVKYLKTI